jgi:hypothetical protein
MLPLFSVSLRLVRGLLLLALRLLTTLLLLVELVVALMLLVEVAQVASVPAQD